MKRPTGSDHDGEKPGPRPATATRQADVVDALLICPRGHTRDTYAQLLAAEGYRLRTVDSIPLAELSLRRQHADIGFMPSAEAQASTRSWRRRVEDLAIPIVVLGDGWTERVHAASRYAPLTRRLATL
jgi:hypothetical protein